MRAEVNKGHLPLSQTFALPGIIIADICPLSDLGDLNPNITLNPNHHLTQLRELTPAQL